MSTLFLPREIAPKPRITKSTTTQLAAPPASSSMDGSAAPSGEVDPMLRLPHVLQLTGCAQSTWHRYVKDGHAPRGRRLGPNTVGWPLSEIQAWLKSRPLA
jgi:predicted DNA-binding transcriptional regulator AlpA